MPAVSKSPSEPDAPVLQVLATSSRREGESVRCEVRTHRGQRFTLAFTSQLARSAGYNLVRAAKTPRKPRKPTGLLKLPLLKPCGRMLIVLLCLALSGCALLPTWRPWGTPIERAEKKDKQEQQAKEKTLEGVQELTTKARLSLNAAGDARPVVLAGDFLDKANALLAQSVGTPDFAAREQWAKLVTDLLSENAQVRAAAEAQRDRDTARLSELSSRLSEATLARERAEDKVREYAKENEALANYFRKAVWIIVGLGGLWLLSQALSIVARINPAFSGAASLVNAVAAPAVQYTLNKAQALPERIGQFMASVRATSSDLAAKIEPLIDGVTDQDHQDAIAAAAKAAAAQSTTAS